MKNFEPGGASIVHFTKCDTFSFNWAWKILKSSYTQFHFIFQRYIALLYHIGDRTYLSKILDTFWSEYISQKSKHCVKEIILFFLGTFHLVFHGN